MLDNCESYDVYMKKLSVWALTMPAPKAQLGALVTASIPNQSTRYKKYLQDKLFKNMCKQDWVALMSKPIALPLKELISLVRLKLISSLG